MSDDGPGVPPNLVPHLFAPMRSSLATIEHAGLGLALVRQMTITLGGDIAYEPDDDAGARFVLHLARARRSNETADFRTARALRRKSHSSAAISDR